MDAPLHPLSVPATDTSSASPTPVSRPRAYQAQGVTWLVSRFREGATRALALLDEPGLGKSLQALLAALALGTRRIIIAAPAGARRVWFDEIRRWAPGLTPHVFVIEPGVRPNEALPFLDRPDLVLLVSYDALSERPRAGNRWLVWSRRLQERRWDLLVLDEAHYLKNHSNRTVALYGPRGDTTGIQAACERVLLLTGTITPNHTGELWQHMRTLWPETLVFPGRDRPLMQPEFEERFTHFRDNKWGRQILASKHQDQLRERLAPFMLRRTKQMVLPELPPLVTQDVPLLVPDHKHVDRVAWRHGQTLWARTRKFDDNAFITELHRAQTDFDDGNPLATLRRELGLLKVEPAAEWVHERFACGTRKMLIFGWHLDVLRRLHALLHDYHPAIVTGATPMKARAVAVRAFQTDPHTRVFIGQILAAGTAITLTAASEVAILEPSWVPGENKQAIDRAHRLGQRDSVLASFLYLPNTLDARIMAVFRRKAVEIAGLEPTAVVNPNDKADDDAVHCASDVDLRI